MKKGVLLISILLLSLVLVSAELPRVVVKEGELVNLKPKAKTHDVELTYTFSEPLDEEGKWQTEAGDAGEYEIKIVASDGESTVTKKVVVVVEEPGEEEPKEEEQEPEPVPKGLEVFVAKEGMTPEELTVKKGSTVVWVIKDDRKHLLIEKNKGLFKSPTLVKDEKFEFTFETVGTFRILDSLSIKWATVNVVEELEEEPKEEETPPEEPKEEEKKEEEAPPQEKVEEAPPAEEEPKEEPKEEEKKEETPPDEPEEKKEEPIEEKKEEEKKEEETTPAEEEKPEEPKEEPKEEETPPEEPEEIKPTKKENRAPLVEMYDGITVTEGDLVKLEPEVTDPDGDKVTVTYSGWMQSDRYQTGYNDAGTYTVTITASDGSLKTVKAVKIEILNKALPPKFTSDLGNKKVKEGEQLTFEVNAEEADGTPVDVSAVQMPEEASFDGKTFSWTPSNDKVEIVREWYFDFLRRIGYKHKYGYKLSFKAVGKEGEVTQDMVVIVVDQNRAPVFNDVGEFILNESQKIEIGELASDPDGDDITYSFEGEPWPDLITGMASYDSAGDHKVTVVASDGRGGKAEKEIIFVVGNVNRPPEFPAAANLYVNENEEIEIKLNAVDHDGDELTYYIVNPPFEAELEIDNATGAHILEEAFFKWKPNYEFTQEETKEQRFDFIVKDSKGLLAEQSITIIVNNVNRPPKLLAYKPKSKKTIAKGTAVIFEIKAEDADGDELKYFWKYKTFGKLEGKSKMKRTFRATGKKKIRVYVCDDEACKTKTWTVTVKEPKKTTKKK